MDKTVDVAIIGAGTAGLNALSQIRKETDNFVLINDGPLGTTCARVGCMPSKIMIQIGNDYHRRHVLDFEGIEQGDRLFIDVAEAMAYLQELRDMFTGGIIEDIIRPLGEKFIDGRAAFVDPTVLRVGESTIKADTVVIATGSRPVIPRQWEHLEEFILTTDTIFEQTDLPRHIAVIGLGLIGLELGQAMHHMGLEVTGVDQLELIGGLQDPEVNRAAVKALSAELTLFLGTAVRIEKNRARLRITAGDRAFEVDKMLLSVGRTPNLAGLQLERLGVELNDNGLPPFDRHTMQIEDLPVFIAGDVANDRPVLHEVDHEGTVAGYNAVHRPVQRFRRKAPLRICFTEPNICVAGASWGEVKDKDPAVGGAVFQGGRERIMQRTGGMIRIYADRQNGRLLGSEMAAPHGEHLAHLLAWSIQQDLTVFDLLAMPFYHPTVEESLNRALKDLAANVERGQEGPVGLEQE